MGCYVTMPKASQLWIKAHQSIMRSLARRDVVDGAASSLTSGRPSDGEAMRNRRCRESELGTLGFAAVLYQKVAMFVVFHNITRYGITIW